MSVASPPQHYHLEHLEHHHHHHHHPHTRQQQQQQHQYQWDSSPSSLLSPFFAPYASLAALYGAIPSAHSHSYDHADDQHDGRRPRRSGRSLVFRFPHLDYHHMASSASAAAAPASAVSTAAIVTATSSSPSSSSSSPSASSSGAAGTWDETIKTGKFLIAGGVAGAVSRTCVSPLERLKILFQIKLTPTAAQEQAPTVWRSLVHIFKTEGLMGYFKGNGTNVIRMIPYSAVQFAAYEQYKKLLLTYPSPVDDLNTPRRLFAGAMAGITSVCATYPLDLIRTRLSAQGEGPDRKYKGIYDCLRTILREEGGARGLFRGLSPTLMGVAPYVALNFTVYESIKRWLLDQMQVKELSVPVRLLCGALAGATAQSITYPFDVIRRRMQMKGCSGPSFAYTSTLNAFTTIIRVEGVRGLYKGMVPNCLKVAPSMSISFVMYEFCKKLLFGGEVQGGRGAL